MKPARAPDLTQWEPALGKHLFHIVFDPELEPLLDIVADGTEYNPKYRIGTIRRYLKGMGICHAYNILDKGVVLLNWFLKEEEGALCNSSDGAEAVLINNVWQEREKGEEFIISIDEDCFINGEARMAYVVFHKEGKDQKILLEIKK